MRRREFITLCGGAALAWPLPTRAQQPSMPLVGFLSTLSQAQIAHLIPLWKRGLGETGYIEGKNVAIEYRFADGQYDRLPAFAAELVGRQVALITTAGPPAALAAKGATTTIPIVFVVGNDPVSAGLVASFNRPGGNATGMTTITGTLAQKRLEILREFLSTIKIVSLLANPTSPDARPEIENVQTVAQALRYELRVVNASTPSEIEAAFATLGERHPDVLMISSDPFFTSRREQLVALAARLGVPTIYPFREFPAVGGLISYGASIGAVARQAGIYCGRILDGANPAVLPVQRPTTFELVINMKTAKALRFEVPEKLLALADEVIE